MGTNSELTLIFLLIPTLCLQALITNTRIYHPRVKMTWQEARVYCQENYIDLVAGNQVNSSYLAELLIKISVKKTWIGLYRDPDQDSNWKWINVRPGQATPEDDLSLNLSRIDGQQGSSCAETRSCSGNVKSGYRTWAQGQPLTGDCGSFDAVTKRWSSTQCSKELRFSCFGDRLVVVKKNKTWEEALEYCRSLNAPCRPEKRCKYDLPSMKRKSDYDYVMERIYTATTNEVWTGLRFLGGSWFWLNGMKVDHQGMLPDCPSQWRHCGTLSKSDTNKWLTRDCAEKRNFICYRFQS